MATYRAHLLGRGRLQVLVDFLGIFAVLRIPGAHTLHLTALAVQAAMDIFQRLLHTEPVHHVLAVQALSNVVQIGQHHGGILRRKVPVSLAGSHLAGQLVQVREQMADNLFVSHADLVRRNLNV